MLEHAVQSDIVVLASGDGDFDMLINKVRDKHNVFSEIYGVPSLTANSLINSASTFIPITQNLLLK